jgi:hypothetical protein
MALDFNLNQFNMIGSAVGTSVQGINSLSVILTEMAKMMFSSVVQNMQDY